MQYEVAVRACITLANQSIARQMNKTVIARPPQRLQCLVDVFKDTLRFQCKTFTTFLGTFGDKKAF